MNLNIKTVQIQKKVLNGIRDYIEFRIKASDFAWILSDSSAMLRGFCDTKSYEENFANYLYEMADWVSEEIYLYLYDHGLEDSNTAVKLPDNVEHEIQEAIVKNIDKIEKLIIRGNIEGEPITESERAEWWKKQKEREREEFYKQHGYYED